MIFYSEGVAAVWVSVAIALHWLSPEMHEDRATILRGALTPASFISEDQCGGVSPSSL